MKGTPFDETHQSSIELIKLRHRKLGSFGMKTENPAFNSGSEIMRTHIQDAE